MNLLVLLKKRLLTLLNGFVVLALALLLPLAACGKKGPPIPQDAKNIFTMQAAKATRSTVINNGVPENCITLLADMTGATDNVEAFLLELEPQTGDICLECPFTPSEAREVVPIATQSYQSTVRYTFSYCPATQADSYRLRLVARNVYAMFPFQMTKILTIGK